MNLRPIKANMNEAKIGDLTVLFSYKTPVAYLKNGQYYITNKFWSRTTTRHINDWIPGNPKLRQHTFGINTVSQETLDSLLNEVK